MSAVITVFSKDFFSEEKVFEYVKVHEGYVMEAEDPNQYQGVVEKGEATIWVYYSKNIDFYKTETTSLKEKYDFDVRTVIQIELNSVEESRQIALDFCKSLLNDYPNTLVFDGSFSKCYDCSELMRIKVTDEGLWSFA